MPAATTPNCETVQPWLSTYLDNEATPTESALVEAHLRACGRCASELAFLRLTHAVLSDPPEAWMPARLSARIAAATYARPTPVQRLADWLRPTPTRLALGSVLAATGVIAASVLLRGGSVPGPSGDVAVRPGPMVAVTPKPNIPSTIPDGVRKKNDTHRVVGSNPARQEPISGARASRVAVGTVGETAAAAVRPTRMPSAKTPIRIAAGVPKPSEQPMQNPTPSPKKPLPLRENPIAAPVNTSPLIASQDAPVAAVNPSATEIVRGPDTLPTDAPPTPPEARVQVAMTGRNVAGALRGDGRIRISRSSENVAGIVHAPGREARSGLVRPVSFSEPGQPLEANVSFVSAPASIR